MPFFITRAQSPGTPPLYAVKEHDGEIMWDARKRYATFFNGDEADEIAAMLGRSSTADISVVGAGASTPQQAAAGA